MNNECKFNNLPVEIRAYILSFSADIKSLTSVAGTCKMLRDEITYLAKRLQLYININRITFNILVKCPPYLRYSVKELCMVSQNKDRWTSVLSTFPSLQKVVVKGSVVPDADMTSNITFVFYPNCMFGGMYINVNDEILCVNVMRGKSIYDGLNEHNGVETIDSYYKFYGHVA